MICARKEYFVQQFLNVEWRLKFGICIVGNTNKIHYWIHRGHKTYIYTDKKKTEKPKMNCKNDKL